MNGKGWLAAMVLALMGLTTLTMGCIKIANGAYRLHTISRAGNERYLVVYGEGDIKAFTPHGAEVPVIISDTADAYIWSHSATPDDLRFITIGDDTLILNTRTVPTMETSLDYTITKVHKDHNALISWSPDRNTYHSVEGSTSATSVGYWKYTAESDGWARWTGPTMGRDWAQVGSGSHWTDITKNPMGFTVTFIRPDDLRSFEYNVVVDFAKDPPSDMHDVALRFQNALHSLGATDALVAWEYLGSKSGQFHITSPYRNTGATIRLAAPSSSALNLTRKGHPFNRGRFRVGNNPVLPPVGSTQAVVDRWTRVPAPGQKDAQPNAKTMPVRMVRLAAPDYRDYVMNLRDEVGNLTSWAYWRLGDSGVTAADETGHWDGCYANSPAHATGALAGDPDQSASFVRTSSQYVHCGTLGLYGGRLYTNGCHMHCWLKTSNTSNILGVMGVIHAGRTTARVLLNTTNGTDVTADAVYVHFRDEDGNELEAYAPSSGLTDGQWHHLAIGPYFNTSEKRIIVCVDGVNFYTGGKMVQVRQGFCDNFASFTSPFCIGAIGGTSVTHCFDGQIDEVVLCLGELPLNPPVLDLCQPIHHYLRGTHSRVFEIDLVDWGFRQTGDDNTNPPPSIFTDGKPITTISFDCNRLLMGNGKNVAFSRVNNFFDFYSGNADGLVRASSKAPDRVAAEKIARDKAREEGINVEGYKVDSKQREGAWWVFFDVADTHVRVSGPAHFTVRVTDDGKAEIMRAK